VISEARPVEARSDAGVVTPASESTLLAVDRTRLAHERTLMAWVRTATSMISFGFSIAKLVPNVGPGGASTGREGIFDTRTFASIMIGVALIALLAATIQDYRAMKALRARYPSNVPRSTALAVAALVAGFGIFAFIGVRLGR
jgi:putative membrane protein